METTMLPSDLAVLRAAARDLAESLDRAEERLQHIGALSRPDAVQRAAESARTMAAIAASHLLTIDEFNQRRGGHTAFRSKFDDATFSAIADALDDD